MYIKPLNYIIYNLMDFCHSLEYIYWNICYHPTTAINKITKKTITDEELDSVIKLKTIESNDTSLLQINFPMGSFHIDYYIYEKNCDAEVIPKFIKISKLFTLRQLLTYIYNFYQEPLLSSVCISNPIFHFSKSRINVFKKIKQTSINYYLNKDPFYDVSCLKNINVFTDYKITKFCGITFNKYTNEYTVLIK